MSNFKIDHNRKDRIGFPEVVYSASKDVKTIKNILEHMLERNDKVLLTKLQPEKYEELKTIYKNTFYDFASGIMMVGKIPSSRKKNPEVAILSGGTSDEFVVNEAHYTLEFMGIKSKRFIDVGAAGIHRLTSQTSDIMKSKIIIVCAGFEGALATVVGGLFPQPIIAVPVSVGYGVAEGGNVALNAMLSSCANGLTVTNIDNGYGAAMAALRMINIMKKK